jgi:pyruvate dehydrogenase E2 component (dihydrolipoyllysine-residue acetyltransferase)
MDRVGTEPHALKGETQIQEPSRAERAIARRHAETRATVPDLELGATVDAEAALVQAREHGCTMTAVLARACALALAEHPRANGAYRDGQYEFHSRVNVALAVQTDDGYVAPTLLDADRKPLAQLGAEFERAAARARAGQLTPPELAGATFTLADLGEYRITRASAFLVASQAATIAAGAVRPAPVVRDGAVVAGHTIGLTLACDGRILFGAHAALFLSDVAERIEHGRV